MTKRRALAVLLCATLALIPLARPFATRADAPPGPVVVELWHSMGGPKGRLLAGMIDKFNHRPEFQGKIEARLQYVGTYTEGLNKLRTALLAGRGPHLVQITDIGTQVMVDSGRIVPLQDLIDHDPEFPLAQLLPQIRHYYEIGGRLYSLPFATSNPILYYNRDAFDKAGITKAPATFAELEETARRLTDPATKIQGITWPLESWFVEEFMARQGTDFVEPGNGRTERARSANYLAPAARDFIGLWARMVDQGTFSNVGRGWDPAMQNFLAGRTKMLITSTSDILEMMKNVTFRVGTAPIPTRDASAPGGIVVGGNSLWLMKDKPEVERLAAYRLLKYLASAESQEEWHTHTGYFPIRQDVIDSLKARGFYDKYPQAWTAIEQLRRSPDLPATRGALMGVFPEAREHVMTAIEEILSKRRTLEDALTRAKAKTDFSLLRNNRGKAER